MVSAGASGWVPAADTVSLDWPGAADFTIVGNWRHGRARLTLVEDELIARQYLCSTGRGASQVLRELADWGLLLAPKALLEAARAADWWAELGDTLYDLVAGCIDPESSEVYAIWERRLHDEHPLVRSAACWAGPYLQGERIAAALESVAGADESPQVRTSAQESASVIRRR
jgi:hypothetical protein